jgi:hypothetical protein
MIILSNFTGYNYIFVSYLMFIILINVMLYFKLNLEWSFFPCLPGLKFPVSRSEYYQIFSTMCGGVGSETGLTVSYSPFTGEKFCVCLKQNQRGAYLVTKIHLFFYKSDDLSSCLILVLKILHIPVVELRRRYERGGFKLDALSSDCSRWSKVCVIVTWSDHLLFLIFHVSNLFTLLAWIHSVQVYDGFPTLLSIN